MNAVERGRRLKELREAAGLLLRHVGAEFDIDKASVSLWETGRSAPDRRKLARLDELYKADGEVLAMFDVAPTRPLPPPEVGHLSRRLDEIEHLAEVTLPQLTALGKDAATNRQRIVALEKHSKSHADRLVAAESRLAEVEQRLADLAALLDPPPAAESLEAG